MGTRASVQSRRRNTLNIVRRPLSISISHLAPKKWRRGEKPFILRYLELVRISRVNRKESSDQRPTTRNKKRAKREQLLCFRDTELTPFAKKCTARSRAKETFKG